VTAMAAAEPSSMPTACSTIPTTLSLPALNRHRHRSRHPVLCPARNFSELQCRFLLSPA
jgi:hypothetical protein